MKQQQSQKVTTFSSTHDIYKRGKIKIFCVAVPQTRHKATNCRLKVLSSSNPLVGITKDKTRRPYFAKKFRVTTIAPIHLKQKIYILTDLQV